MNHISAEQLKYFQADLDQIYKDAVHNISHDDFKHLRKIELWGRLSSFCGYLTGVFLPNPISAFLISLGRFTRWTMIAHHVCHRGYDKVPGIPERYTSAKFAKGWRRYVDWFDWIFPSAWDIEHNKLHHFNLNEKTDPDLLEDTVTFIHQWQASVLMKRFIFVVAALTWKMHYYAWNTWRHLMAARQSGRLQRIEKRWDPYYLIDIIKNPLKYKRFIIACWAPYFLFNFAVLPTLLYLIHPWIGISLLINMILAEAITNIHSFCVILPNHAGRDLFRFQNRIKGKAEFYLHQILGTTNYHCGSDVNDFLHGWLNYQIEHHLWPHLSMLQYKKIQPKVKAVCEKYHLPYRQESVFKRIFRMHNIFIGLESMSVGFAVKGTAPSKK